MVIFNLEKAIAALASTSASAIIDLVAKAPNPKFVLAPAAVVAPVPPFVIAISVPLHTPVVIVPTLVKLELNTLFAKLFPVSVFASAVIVIFVLPSNATPLIFLVAANLVAVLALPFTLPVKSPFTLPVNAPVKFVAVTVLNPAKDVVVAPNEIFVDPIVNALFVNLLFVILPANFALVILKSATPALALCKSTYVFTAFCEGYKISLGFVLPKSVAVLLLLLASAPNVLNAPVAVDVPVPPFTIDTTPVTFAALPVIFPEGVA